MVHFWPLTFGMMGFWLLAGVVELVKTTNELKKSEKNMDHRSSPVKPAI